MALKFFWRCEGASLDGTHDYSAGGTAMTLVGTASISGAAAKLGSNGVATVDSIDLYYLATTSIVNATANVGAIGFWIQFPTTFVTSGNPIGVTFEEPTWSTTNNWIGVRSTGAGFELSMRSSASAVLSLDSGATGLTTGTWYFVTAAWDIPNDKRKIAVYDASGTLISSAEDTSTDLASREPTTITRFDVGNRSGNNNAVYVDNVFVGDAYVDAAAFYTNRNITSYTEYGEIPTGTSGGLVVGSATSFVGEGFVGAVEGAGNTQPTGLATETDAALGLARRKAKATQLATETDGALALVAKHARTAGLATQTDTALAGGRQKAKVTALASEAETALALGRKKAKAVGIAIETDSALAVSRRKTRSAGRSDEIDAALALGAPLGVGLASETDSALALARRKSKAVQLATTTETALALTARKVRLCGTAAETDAALALARRKVRACGTAVEADSALNLARRKIRSCGRADETDSAVARPPLGIIARPVGLAVETDTAFALLAASGGSASLLHLRRRARRIRRR